jgi:hypothetical protein
VTPVLRYVLDEHVPRALWSAIQGHNRHGAFLIDVVRVGDPPDLPLGNLDPEILLWAERERRILVSLDKGTLPGHLADHLSAGRHSPGILIIRQSSTLREVVAYLVMAAYAGNPGEYQDGITYIPY